MIRSASHMKRLSRRLLLFFLLLVLILFPIAAGAVGESIANGLMVVAGVALAPFTYGASLALTGAGISGFVTSSAEKDAQQAQEEQMAAQQAQQQIIYEQQYINSYNSAYNNYLSAQSLAQSIQANISNAETDILQTQANISSFDQSLVRWQSQYDQQRLQIQSAGESAYSQLMQNWQGAELINATRGQTGGSASLVAQSQLQQVERLTGADLKLDSNGGTFGTYLNEFRLDMLAGRSELVGNMNIQKQALQKYNSVLSSYKSQLSSAQTAISTAQKQYLQARQDAIDFGISPSLVGA